MLEPKESNLSLYWDYDEQDHITLESENHIN